MRRREFIGAVVGAGVWPVAAQAQQTSPVIGVLGIASQEAARAGTTLIRARLAEMGYVEGHNLAIEYRWADYQQDRLPGLADDLVRRKVTGIIALDGPPTVAAKNATESIPIIFMTGFDPVASGYVRSLNRPGGNVTGVFILNPQALLKRLEFLHELVPAAKSIAFFYTDTGDQTVMPYFLSLREHAEALGVGFPMFSVSLASELEDAFAKVETANAGALLVNDYAVFSGNLKLVVVLAERHKLPTMYPTRGFVAAGGLVSYGTDVKEALRRVGDLVGGVLKGQTPEDLPVQQVTKLELVINAKTAKSLGLEIPTPLLGLAEIIE
jgi:putative tryptophan/tyrosine transport system substrate-binding protein